MVAEPGYRIHQATSWRRWIWAFSAGLLSFLGSYAVLLGITWLTVWPVSPEFRHPTDAGEGFANAWMALYPLILGGMLSFVVAAGVGAVVASHVHRRARMAARTRKDVPCSEDAVIQPVEGGQTPKAQAEEPSVPTDLFRQPLPPKQGEQFQAGA
jgi:hypothetical protein